MKPTKDQLEELYWKQGLTLGAIGAKYGCHEVTVMKWMERAEIPRRPRNHRKGANHTPEARALIAQAHIGTKMAPETKAKIAAKLRGPLNHKWQGGKRSLRKAIRSLPQYADWRYAIFERDAYTCVFCGATGKLNADHVIPFREIIARNSIVNVEAALSCPELWDLNNGRTLCVPCHKQTPTYGNRRLA